MSNPALEVRDLVHVYPDGTRALSGVSFVIEPGDSVALIGANGAGKSTLLLHLNGCLAATAGEVCIDGTTVTRGTAEAARRAVGMVFQDPDDQLFMPTVAEDVAFGPLNAGLAAEEVERRVTTALERVGLLRARERPPYRLSAGEKRAAAIATVLAMEPAILVMDEPSSHLDPLARRRLIEYLNTLKQTRIIATHDLELVVETCRLVLVMDAGRLVAQGSTRDILGDEALMVAHGLERPHSLGHVHQPPSRCCLIAYGSPEHAAALVLREEILRRPLGLQFTQEQLLAERGDFHLACFLADRLVGCLVLTPAANNAVRMRQVAVAADGQRQGIGTRLVKQAESVAVAQGYRRMTAHARVTALGFYDKLGYATEGEPFIEAGIPHVHIFKSLS